MSQHDQNIANDTGAAVRADLNSVLAALFGTSSGATAPSTTLPYQFWADTTSGLLKQRNAANTGWLVRGTLAETFVLARSSNTILGVGDCGRTFVATSTFTQTLDAVATLGDGWFADYRNDGSGIITIDPNGAELIDGASTIKLYPGESCRILCNGSALKTRGRSTGLVLIQTQVASGAAQVDFTIGIDSAFDEYLFNYSDVTPGSDTNHLYMRASIDGGSSFLTTNAYAYAGDRHSGAGAGFVDGASAADQIILNGNGMGTDTGEFCSGNARLFAPSGTSRYKGVVSQSFQRAADAVYYHKVQGAAILTTSAVNAIRFLAGSGNLNGTFSLYGVRK